MTLYVYRDDLEGEKYGYYGVNLYFCWDQGNQDVNQQRTLTDSFDVSTIFDLSSTLADVIKGKGHDTAVSAITKWVTQSSPIIVFFRNCIDSGTGQNRCLSLAKTAGIKYRRQNALALYKVLSLEKEFLTSPLPAKPGKPAVTTIDPPFELYEAVQQHFSDELELHMGMNYAPNDLSEEWSDDNDMEHGDFVFEIGEKKSATFRYYGNYHGDTDHWKPLKMFNDFDVRTLTKLLKRINHA